MDGPSWLESVTQSFSDWTETFIVEVSGKNHPDEIPHQVRIDKWWHDDKHRGPETVAILSPQNAWMLGLQLQHAAEEAEMARAKESSPKSLPSITICGREFYVDERLRQLRSVENPHHYFDLDEK